MGDTATSTCVGLVCYYHVCVASSAGVILPEVLLLPRVCGQQCYCLGCCSVGVLLPGVLANSVGVLPPGVLLCWSAAACGADTATDSVGAYDSSAVGLVEASLTLVLIAGPATVC